MLHCTEYVIITVTPAWILLQRSAGNWPQSRQRGRKLWHHQARETLLVRFAAGAGVSGQTDTATKFPPREKTSTGPQRACHWAFPFSFSFKFPLHSMRASVMPRIKNLEVAVRKAEKE